jgi:transcriptional regulator with XRE-family HTH domain
MDIVSSNVAKALNSVMRTNNLTVKQMAERIDIRPEHLSKYLNRKLSISFERGYEIAKKLESSSEYTRVFRYSITYQLSSESCKYFY